FPSKIRAFLNKIAVFRYSCFSCPTARPDGRAKQATSRQSVSGFMSNSIKRVRVSRRAKRGQVPFLDSRAQRKRRGMSQKLRVPTASVKEKLLKKEPDPFSVSFVSCLRTILASPIHVIEADRAGLVRFRAVCLPAATNAEPEYQ